MIGLLLVGDKGLNVLREILDLKDDIKFVMSYSDPNTKDNSFTQIKNMCEDNNISFQKGKTITYDTSDVDNIFVIGWQFLIKGDVQEKLVVIHDSVLPEYKGWAPTVNYLIKGSKYLGATAFRPTDEMDTGPILSQIKKSIIYPMKIKDAIDIVSDMYIDMIRHITENNPSPTEMNTDESFCVWRNKDDYIIDLNWDAEKIKRFVDAVGYPYDGAKIKFCGHYLPITNCEVVYRDIIGREDHIGKVFSKSNDGYNFEIICGKNNIRIEKGWVLDLYRKPLQLKRLKVKFGE
jgi:methionyl-tRNA formyltransferase